MGTVKNNVLSIQKDIIKSIKSFLSDNNIYELTFTQRLDVFLKELSPENDIIHKPYHAMGILDGKITCGCPLSDNVDLEYLSIYDLAQILDFLNDGNYILN